MYGDRVKDGYTTISQEDRPIVLGWLKDHPEYHEAPRYSVYLGNEVKYLSVAEYLAIYGGRR